MTDDLVKQLRVVQMRGARYIIDQVAAYYGLPVAVLVAEKGRQKEISEARQMAAYLIHRCVYWPHAFRDRRRPSRKGTRPPSVERRKSPYATEMPIDPRTGKPQRALIFWKQRFPYSVIGELLGRDHSTSMHAVAVTRHKRTADHSIAYAVTTLTDSLTTPSRRTA